MYARVRINGYVVIVQLWRCQRHISATFTHTHKYLPSSHTACEALKIVIPILDKNPCCPSPGLLPPPFEMPLHPYNSLLLVSDQHTIISYRSTRRQHTRTRIPPVHFHSQRQVVQQRLDVVLKPLRIAGVQALMQTLGISAENLLACLHHIATYSLLPHSKFA